MNIEAYIKEFYQTFRQDYKLITAAKNSMLSNGYTESHYNDTSPSSNLLYPTNRNFHYQRDYESTDKNKFIGISLYSKENATSKFFDLVNKNPILNLAFPEKDNLNYNIPVKHEYFKTLCSRFDNLTDLNYSSLSTNDEIRFEFKKIALLILDTPRRKSVTTNKYFTIKVNGEEFKFRDQFDAMYFLSDAPISIYNPYYPNLFVYTARFEFENYSKLISKAAII